MTFSASAFMARTFLVSSIAAGLYVSPAWVRTFGGAGAPDATASRPIHLERIRRTFSRISTTSFCNSSA